MEELKLVYDLFHAIYHLSYIYFNLRKKCIYLAIFSAMIWMRRKIKF